MLLIQQAAVPQLDADCSAWKIGCGKLKRRIDIVLILQLFSYVYALSVIHNNWLVF